MRTGGAGHPGAMTMIEQVLDTMRLRRPAELCSCPVCARRVTDRDDRVRLRGSLYVHRNCATYRVRQVNRARPRSL